MAFSPDGKLLAAGGRWTVIIGGFNPKLGVLCVYDARTGGLIRDFEELHDVWAIAFAPDGRTMAVGTNSGNQVLLFDTTTWKPRRELVAGRVTSLAYSPDGRLLAVSCLSDGHVSLFKTDTGDLWKKLAGPPAETSVLSVAFSPDGHTLALGCYDMTARLYDVETGDLKGLRKTAGWANSVAFSPDGTLLAVGGRSATVIWNWGVDPAP